MKRARAPIAVPAGDMEAAVVTAAVVVAVVMAVVVAEAAIVTAIVAPAATTANQGGNLASAVSGRWISVSDRQGGPQIKKRQKSDGAKASISILALFIWWAAAEWRRTAFAFKPSAKWTS